MSVGFDQHFLTVGIEYYVAGRGAALLQLNRVSGNLLHHAVEMLLKGVLVADVSVKELRTTGHKLIRLWELFTKRHDQKRLAEFDEVIRKLDAFERIRYPDHIVNTGAVISTGFGATAAPHPSDGTKWTEPIYAVNVHEVDRLVSAIFETSSFNVSFFKKKLTPKARRILAEGNECFDCFLSPTFFKRWRKFSQVLRRLTRSLAAPGRGPW